MNLKLVRKYPGKDCVIGELYVNGVFECYTLEDKERPIKIAGVTAIPRGFYEVIIDFSNRFQRQMPRLLNVPNYDGVRIHTGNIAANTEGCILVGKSKATDSILKSKDAYGVLFPKLVLASQTEKIIIEITGDNPVPSIV